eukprot:4714498-Lingulodinium_polyedra.AAC.2
MGSAPRLRAWACVFCWPGSDVVAFLPLRQAWPASAFARARSRGSERAQAAVWQAFASAPRRPIGRRLS